jgi:hypothetical protein|nr:MAG TPA: protein of unknown function (DUF4585) [Caudoviricetes sp.]
MKESEEALQALKSSFSYDPETGFFLRVSILSLVVILGRLQAQKEKTATLDLL